MATSSSVDFEIDVAEYIEEAFERCGIEIRTGYDLRSARRSMNLLFADWANRGLNQWTITQRTQALTASDADYTLDYINLPTKTTTGRPSQFFLDRQITPNLKIWSAPENSTDVLIYDALTRIQDADASVNTVDIPFRFYPCLTAGLAYYLAMKRAPDRIKILKAVYEEEFERAAAEDRDRASLSLTPSTTYYGLI